MFVSDEGVLGFKTEGGIKETIKLILVILFWIILILIFGGDLLYEAVFPHSYWQKKVAKYEKQLAFEEERIDDFIQAIPYGLEVREKSIEKLEEKLEQAKHKLKEYEKKD